MFAIIHAAVVSAIVVTAAMLWRYGGRLPHGFARCNAGFVAGLALACGAMLAAAAMVARFAHGHGLHLAWHEVDPMLRGLVVIGVPIAFCNLATMAILRGLAALPGDIESLDGGAGDDAPAPVAPKPLGYRMAAKLGTFLRLTAVLWILSGPGLAGMASGAPWVVSSLLVLVMLIDGGLLIADPEASTASRVMMIKVALAVCAAYLIYGQLDDRAGAWSLAWSILTPAALLVLSLILHFAMRLSARRGRPAPAG